jgi:ParB-like chromosome segregation protein Spo0J
LANAPPHHEPPPAVEPPVPVPLLHPLCAMFPPIEGAAFDELVASIREFGLKELITILDEQVLDGANRQRACLAAGVDPLYEPFRGDDPLRFVIAKNISRRHLSESQRALLAAQIADLAHGGNRKLDQPANLPGPTQAEAAEMLNVSERSVRTARKVLKGAEPDDIEAINSGKASVSGVANKLSGKENTSAVREEADDCPECATPEEATRLGFLNVAATARAYATYHDLSGVVIDQNMIFAARKVVQAWSACVRTLKEARHRQG